MILETAVRSLCYLGIFFVASWASAYYLGKVMNRIDMWFNKDE